MGHEHNVRDLDARFTIDPVTKQIKNESKKKLLLAQGDHNSEIYGFRCPRYIESHDMSLCNKVEVHFFNYESQTKKFNSGKYEVKDLKIGEDEDTVEFSWLISGNGTQLEGYTEFLIRFKCVDENNIVTYAWNTLFFSDVNVGRGSTVDELFETEYVDIIEHWKAKVMRTFKDDLTAWKTVTAEAVRKEAFEDIATERKRIDFLSNYVTPEMFGAKGDGVTDDHNALKTCFEFADKNFVNVALQSKVYCTSSPLTSNLAYVIYGNNGVLKAISEMDAVLTINKPDETTAAVNYKGCSTVYDLNIDGNSCANKGLYVRYGKGITIKNLRIKAATNAQMQVSDENNVVWELIADNVELRSAFSDGYSPYGLLIAGENTDSYFRNFLIINSSEAWVDCESSACVFENFHGYGYPENLAADVGFVFRGNGNRIKDISVDTPMNKGIVVNGSYNAFINIIVAKMQAEKGVGIEVNGNANTFEDVRCSTYYCFYITSGENTIDEFKCLKLFTRSEYDYFFTGKLPYRGVFDTKTEAVNNIKRNFIFNNLWFYQSVLDIVVNFENEFRYNHYNVHVVGVDKSAPNYSLVKTTTGCTITCEDSITSGRKVNIVIDSPSIKLI